MEINLDAATGEITTRELTQEENDELQKNKKEYELAKIESMEKRAAALAKLAAIGLEEEDLRALGM